MANPVTEKRWEYKGFTCVVLFQPLGHRCGYVAIPKGNKLYCVDDNNINVNCHGGLTYSASALHGQDDSDVWWIGFDCVHYGDGRDYETARKCFGNNAEDLKSLRLLEKMDMKFNTFEPVRTLDYCIKECESIVEQLLEMEE